MLDMTEVISGIKLEEYIYRTITQLGNITFFGHNFQNPSTSLTRAHTSWRILEVVVQNVYIYKALAQYESKARMCSATPMVWPRVLE